VNAPLRRAGVVVLVLFALLFVNLNYRQVVMADTYRKNPHNARVQVDDYQHARGKIINAQGVAIADSQVTTDSLKYLRIYPSKDLYAHIVGYRAVNLTPTALERLQDQFLNGNSDSQAADRITALITGKQAAGGNVLLTLDKATQETAYDQLIHNNNHSTQGAIVALDPTTGAMLANVSMPSFDPNPLASHDRDAALAAFNKLDKDPLKPLQNRVFQDTYPPGSTFKVITAAAAETNNPGLTGASVIKGGDTYLPPQTTTPLKNATGDVCPDQITMKQALTVSCNTAFAQLAVNQVGNDKLKAMAQAFGYESQPRVMGDDDTNYFGVVASHTGSMQGPNGLVDPPALAQSAIGQRDVRVTPLQEVMVAATVANGGKEMQPYIIDSLQGADLSNIGGKTQPKLLRTPITSAVASDLQDMMESVVNSSDGTAVKARIDGVTVGGKTGTAANGEGAQDHGWFIGFAIKNGKPLIAIAVFLQNAGRGGSAEASRIGGEVMNAYINEKGGK
jgi:peptidoglycan glycosyltransferase